MIVLKFTRFRDLPFAYEHNYIFETHSLMYIKNEFFSQRFSMEVSLDISVYDV